MIHTPFVRHSSLGLGRLVRGAVRFFDSPAADEVTVPRTDDVSGPEILARQQRVWWHDGAMWLAGYVDSATDLSGSAYWVKFPNGRIERVPADSLRVRWSVPIENPLGLLKAGTVETRYLHTARRRFIASVLGQRAAADGLSGIWSSAVDLYAHQVGAARRVLSDPVRRYLLADEVGLGKTIEAGFVIRQLLLDGPGEVLVLASSGLLEQWREELSSKFRVEQFGGRVRLAAHSEIEALEPSQRLLAVVDEAHVVTAVPRGDDTTYRRLCAIAHHAEGLLLLSATPVRSNEDGFLRMLHLLDPDAYPLDDIAAFRRRVAMRDELATALAALSDETPLAFLSEPISTLRAFLPDEVWLQRELDALELEVERRDVVAVRERSQRVRLQLSETHRIHRRMIRTRRGALLAKAFPVRGRSRADDWLLIDPDLRRATVLEFIDEVRSEIAGVAEIDAGAILRTLLGRASAPVGALADLARALRGEPGHDLDAHEIHSLVGIAGTNAGLAWARRLRAIIDAESSVDRLSAMCTWVWQHIGHAQVVVACSFPSTAADAARRLEAQFGSHRVLRLITGMSPRERANAVRLYTTDRSRAVLVMDRSAEEGVNLQIADAVLHLDLPISAARIEQRLGRFDRHAESEATISKPVMSMAFRDADRDLDAHLGAWRTALDEGMDIFTESSATLQYVLPQVEATFLADALESDLASSGRYVAAQRELLAKQRRRIQAHDLLDALDDTGEDEELFARMSAADNSDEIKNAFRHYVVDMLGFTENHEGVGLRFGVSKEYPPRMTESDLFALEPRSLRGRYAYRRSDARSGAGLLRWGEPLYDRFADYARRDDRGRAFIIEVRQTRRPAGAEPLCVFCFDVLIGPGLEPLDDVEEQSTAVAAAARMRVQRHFPPKLEQVWWSAELDHVPERMRRVLEQAPGGVNLGSRPDRFLELTSGMRWPVLCERAAQEAVRELTQRADIVEFLVSVERSAAAACERENALLAVREQAGHRESADPRVSAAIMASVSAPDISIEACGAVLITAPEALS